MELIELKYNKRAKIIYSEVGVNFIFYFFFNQLLLLSE